MTFAKKNKILASGRGAGLQHSLGRQRDAAQHAHASQKAALPLERRSGCLPARSRLTAGNSRREAPHNPAFYLLHTVV